MVFPTERVAIFVDGDFWHGYRFPRWRNALPAFWQKKIQANRLRDRRTFQQLRRRGWTVLRIWQHEIDADLSACASRVTRAVQTRME